MLRSSIRRAKLSSATSGTSSSADSRHSHASCVSSRAALARDDSSNLAHVATGLLAIILVIAHAAWAAIVLGRKDRETMANFHRFSMAVWTLWLVPYVCDTLMGIPMIDLPANAAFGAALGAAGSVSLILYLRRDARRARVPYGRIPGKPTK